MLTCGYSPPSAAVGVRSTRSVAALSHARQYGQASQVSTPADERRILPPRTVAPEDVEPGDFIELATQFGIKVIYVERIAPRINGIKFTGRSVEGAEYSFGAACGSQLGRTSNF